MNLGNISQSESSLYMT